MAAQPQIKTPIPTTSASHNFALCLLPFAFTCIPIHRQSRPTPNPSSVLHLLSSVLSLLSSGLLLIMQNKPNPQNPQSDPTLYHQEVYEDFNLPDNEKNKPKTNPIQPNPNTLSAPRPTLPNPRLHKSAFCLPIPTTSGFRNFAFCLLHFDFSLPALSPKSAQVSVSAHKLSAKTSKNHNSFAQNKPNPQNPQISPTPYPKKAYKDYQGCSLNIVWLHASLHSPRTVANGLW